MAKRKRRKLQEDVGTFVGSSVMLGVGGQVVSGVGGNASGLSAMSGMMPTLGTVTMGKHTIGMLGEIKPKKKRRKR